MHYDPESPKAIWAMYFSNVAPGMFEFMSSLHDKVMDMLHGYWAGLDVNTVVREDFFENIDRTVALCLQEHLWEAAKHHFFEKERRVIGAARTKEQQKKVAECKSLYDKIENKTPEIMRQMATDKIFKAYFELKTILEKYYITNTTLPVPK